MVGCSPESLLAVCPPSRYDTNQRTLVSTAELGQFGWLRLVGLVQTCGHHSLPTEYNTSQGLKHYCYGRSIYGVLHTQYGLRSSVIRQYTHKFNPSLHSGLLGGPSSGRKPQCTARRSCGGPFICTTLRITEYFGSRLSSTDGHDVVTS